MPPDSQAARFVRLRSRMLYRLLLDPRARWLAVTASLMLIGILSGCQNSGTNSGGGAPGY